MGVARMGGVVAGGESGKAFSMRLLNLDDIVAYLEEEIEDVVDDLEEVLTPALTDLVMIPSQKIVPVDTGALHDSAFVSVVRAGKWRIVAVVGYDTPYAIYVHEIPARHDPPTSWKFLEIAFAQNLDRLEKRIVKDVRRRTR
jgi:tetrahydromethanopterin S-methyltransferase subunit B